MADIVSPEIRSGMMSRIRGKHTKPEMLVRRELFSRGFRYRLHDSRLPGKPDLVFPKYQTALFVNGCFWHGHDCKLFRMPATNREFWEAKIKRNRENDAKKIDQLLQVGWQVVVVWECSLRGVKNHEISDVIDIISAHLKKPETGLLVDIAQSQNG